MSLTNVLLVAIASKNEGLLHTQGCCSPMASSSDDEPELTGFAASSAFDVPTRRIPVSTLAFSFLHLGISGDWALHQKASNFKVKLLLQIVGGD